MKPTPTNSRKLKVWQKNCILLKNCQTAKAMNVKCGKSLEPLFLQTQLKVQSDSKRTTVHIDGSLVQNPKLMADEFCKHFSSIADSI